MYKLARTIGTAALAAGLALSALPAAAQTAIIRYDNAAPEMAPQNRLGHVPLFEQIEAESEGTLEFQYFFASSLIRDSDQTYEALLSGLADASMWSAATAQALFPDLDLFALPGLFTTAEESGTAMWRMYEEGHIGGLDELYVLGLYINGNSGLFLTSEIENLDQVAGSRVRVGGAVESNIVTALGAVPVGMSPGEVASSMSSGVLGGALIGWEALQAFRLDSLVNTYVDLPFGGRVFISAISREKFDSLPQAAQAAIEAHAGLPFSQHLGRVFDDAAASAREHAQTSDEVVYFDISSPGAAEFAERLEAIRETWLEERPQHRDNYEALLAILEDIRS